MRWIGPHRVPTLTPLRIFGLSWRRFCAVVTLSHQQYKILVKINTTLESCKYILWHCRSLSKQCHNECMPWSKLMKYKARVTFSAGNIMSWPGSVHGIRIQVCCVHLQTQFTLFQNCLSSFCFSPTTYLILQMSSPLHLYSSFCSYHSAHLIVGTSPSAELRSVWTFLCGHGEELRAGWTDWH